MTCRSRYRRTGYFGAVVLAAGCFSAPAAEQPLNPKDALAPIYRENPKLADPLADRIRLRNEGIAHYEGGLTLDRGITAFQTAYEVGRQPVDAFDLALIYMKQNKVADARAWAAKAVEGNPDFVPAIYLLGLIDKLDGHADAAKARWSRVNELSPTDPQLHYELAMLANAAKDQRAFLQELLRALELDPQHKSSLYQMYRYYQISGNKEMAAATLKRFNALKAAERFSRKERPFDESRFTRPLHDDQPTGSGGFPYLESDMAFAVERPQTGCPLAHVARVTVAAPAHEDLLGICADNRVVRVAAGTATGLGTLDAPVDDIRVDWLDDMGPRLIAAGPSGIRISGPLDQQPLRLDTIDPTPARHLLLADFDHDGSLDILTDAAAAPLTKIANAWKRQPAVFGASALGHAFGSDTGVRVADLRQRGMADLVTAVGGEVLVITDGATGYQDGLRVRLTDRGNVSQIVLADLDSDGALDLVAATPDGLSVVWGFGGATAATANTRISSDGPVRFAIADVNNDGRPDIVVIDGAGTASMLLNRAPRSFEKRAVAAQLVPLPATDPIVLDADRDGRIDLAYIDTNRELVVLRNVSMNTGDSIEVLLNGRRSPATGHLTQIAARKGPMFAYSQSDGGIVHLGLGKQGYVEILRLEWPNGFVENKIKVDAARDSYVYLESERIAGSCPTIFVRGPDGFQYVTDAMITTAIGILQQRGQYFGFGDEEHVAIPPGLLVESNGRLDLRITEELRETTYIDHASLLAVDLPAGARLGSTERLAPPTAAVPPYFVARHLAPASRATFEGRDVTEELARVDRRYADTVHRTRNPGFAAPSVIDLELGSDIDPGKIDAVFATGWFLAFDSTAVIGAFKGERPDLQFPELQQEVGGAWQSAGYIGIPAGQNRTAVLVLQQPLRSRHLRIVSNFSVYWDEIAFSVAGAATAKIATLPLAEASLRFHGFSHVTQRDPEIFAYDQADYGMLWSPMPGLFTNYGPVRPLLAKKDGDYAVIGGGDEIALSFKAPASRPPAGYERGYVLVLSGHVKDADRYTARSEAVEPMPTLTMTEYPTGPKASPEPPLSARLRQRLGLDYTLKDVFGQKGAR